MAARRGGWRPTTSRKNGHLDALPVELLMQSFGYLVPSLEPYLDDVSLHRYKDAVKDLRNICLTSWNMHVVARTYLYQNVVIEDADTLSYFLRSLSGDESLGLNVKQLLLEVPNDSEHSRYRKPNVAVLDSSPNFEQIRGYADEALDFNKYQRYRDENDRLGCVEIFPTQDFNQWARGKEYKAFGLIAFEILHRTINLKSLYFGVVSGQKGLAHDYFRFFTQIQTSLILRPAGSILSTLTELRVLARSQDEEHMYCPVVNIWPFLLLEGLRTLRYVCDNGSWSKSGLLSAYCKKEEVVRRLRNASKIECIDLRKSGTGPEGIFQICTRFQALVKLSISSITLCVCLDEHDDNLISDSLAKLPHLRELILDLHYEGQVKPVLGPRGVINLAGLTDLVTLRLPLYFLIEMQLEMAPFVTDLTQALPSSLKRLTVWANRDSVTCWGVTSLDDYLARMQQDTDEAYRPRQSALAFLDSVFCRIGHHFRHLEEVVYCYGDGAFDTDCCCKDYVRCNLCKASDYLDPYADDDSAHQMQTLSSNFAARGIRLRTCVEEV